MIVSVPAVALALRTASRKLQDVDVSALLTLLQVVAIAPGAGSSVRFTKNVGSGSGIIAEGAICAAWSAITPGRPSILMRRGRPATSDPLYGRTETCAGRN